MFVDIVYLLYMIATLHACYIRSFSHRIDLITCMTQTTAAETCTIRAQPGRAETTHALPQAIQDELSKPDLDAKTQKLHLPSFGVCKQAKSEKKCKQAICRDWVAKHNRTTRNGVGNCSSKTGSRRQSEKKYILKHFLKGFLEGKS